MDDFTEEAYWKVRTIGPAICRFEIWEIGTSSRRFNRFLGVRILGFKILAGYPGWL